MVDIFTGVFAGFVHPGKINIRYFRQADRR
jgi:hypothetical protein